MKDYIEFKYVVEDVETSIKIYTVDLKASELAEHFREFLLAIGYHPNTVSDLFSESP